MTVIPIYFDTETTGLSAQSERIIELAALRADNGQSFVQLINPGRNIPKEASAIHKITDEMVEGAPGFDLVAAQFLQFCAPVNPGDRIALIAHNNIGFDKLFIHTEFSRSGITIPSDWVFLDTLFWARHYRSDLPRHALQYLREIYGIEANQAHRALDDVIILKAVFEAMIDDLPFEFVCERLLELQSRK